LIFEHKIQSEDLGVYQRGTKKMTMKTHVFTLTLQHQKWFRPSDGTLCKLKQFLSASPNEQGKHIIILLNA